jgi:hypothetical protein
MPVYRGQITTLADGQIGNPLNQSWVTVPIIKIGDSIVEGAVMSSAMYSMLAPGRECVLRVGRFLWKPMLLRVSYEGEAYAVATWTFIAMNLMHAMAFGLILAIAVSAAWRGAAGQGLWLICTAIAFIPNLRRWL